ncbi:EmrE family multidrug efflux SMR transporter [Siccibacter turicensis]|uniref:EmrE family multidrug efflux SMR transporter n=1 Tax=Siccibacter turicensis TaxID=357233 RepID=UPI0004670832|nr:EmrE family multidrug efflux SMR transporter [Siccibacter turicensis]
MPGIWLILGVAIVAEVIGTTLLKYSHGFTRLWPTLGTALCYGIAFWCLSRTLEHIPTGIAYAIWSGVGIVLISIAGWIFSGQKLDLPAMLGMGLIVAGVLVINLFSTSSAH